MAARDTNNLLNATYIHTYIHAARRMRTDFEVVPGVGGHRAALHGGHDAVVELRSRPLLLLLGSVGLGVRSSRSRLGQWRLHHLIGHRARGIHPFEKQQGEVEATQVAKQSQETRNERKGNESRRDEKREEVEVKRGEQGRGAALCCLFTLKESE